MIDMHTLNHYHNKVSKSDLFNITLIIGEHIVPAKLKCHP